MKCPHKAENPSLGGLLSQTICVIFGLMTFFGATMEMQSRKYTEDAEAIRNKVNCIMI